MNVRGLWSLVLLVPLCGQEPAAPVGDDIVARIAAATARIDAERLAHDVRTLVGFGTRHVLSRTDSETEGTGAARRWLRAEFEAIAAASDGRLTVALQEAVVPCARPGMPRQVPIVNVVATLRGTGDAERLYVVSGHYDSRNSRGEDGRNAAPGAVDDASGTAVALEACRVMSRSTWPATILFVAYDGEEQGLLGSTHHAESLGAAGATVDGMITCDIVGNTLGMDGRRYDRHLRCFSYAPTGNDSYGRSLARAATFAAQRHVADFGVELIFRGDRFGRGGDHRPFFAAGFPAVRFSEPREDFSRQHQDVVLRDGKPYGDLPEFADAAYMANVTRVVVATIGELASAPRPPHVVGAQLRRDRYDTEIVYTRPDDAAAVEFVWRPTTAPDWTAVVAEAAARPEAVRGGRWRATLPGVCLDDVVVGVRSIARDGSRSRVVTPPEPDRFEQRRTGGAAPGDSGGNGR